MKSKQSKLELLFIAIKVALYIVAFLFWSCIFALFLIALVMDHAPLEPKKGESIERLR